jgi:hypothetical protein
MYRVVDAIYRVHRDLFEIENILSRTTRLQLRLARITNNGRMATFLVGLLAIVPILIALGDIKWGSAPAIIIYFLAAAVLFLWICQWVSAGNLHKELSTLERQAPTDAFEQRHDFMLEEVNAWAVRHRIVAQILKELSASEQEDATEEIARELLERRKRYEEISAACEKYVEDLIKVSQKLVASGKRSSEEHDELIDWAAAIPKFEHSQSMAED